MTSSSAFRYRVLDRVGVRDRTGARVELRPKESQVLVCLLLELLDADEVSREVIHEIVWPEQPKGRLLDNQLYQLRLKLGDDIPKVSRAESLRLNIDRQAVDAWAFFDAYKEAKVGRGSWSVPLEIWASGRRSKLDAIVDHPAVASLSWYLRTALEGRIAELLSADTPADELLSVLNRLVGTWPEDTGNWLALIRQTARSRGPMAAETVLRQAKAALIALDLPVDDLLQAGHQIIADVAADQRPQLANRLTVASPPAEPAVVGELPRQAEMTELQARVGRSTVTVIDGAPGNGKSWLALRVARESGLPFVRWVFRPGLADTSRKLQIAMAKHFESRGNVAFANLLEQEINRGAQYDERWKATLVAQLLTEMPTYLVLDDFHVIDSTSRTADFVNAVIELAGEIAGPSRILVVTREAPSDAALANEPDTIFGVSKAEAGELLANLGAGVSEGQLNRLYRWTAGNLKLLRMFAGWVVERQADQPEIDRLLIRRSRWPGARQYLLSNFLNDLSSDEYKLVVTLALLRTAVPQSALWEAADFAGVSAFTTVDRLTRRHIVEAVPGGEDYYLHGLLRDFLRDATAESDLTMRHRVAAAAQRAAGSIVEELYHLAASGEHDLALTRLVESEERAVQAGQGAELLALLESWPVDTDTGRPDVALVRGDLLRMSGRLADAENVFRRLTARASQPELRAIAAIGQATTLKNMAEWRRALRVVETATTAVADIEGDTGVLRGICQTVAGSVHAQIGGAPAARAALLTGVDLIRTSRDGPVVTSLRGASRLLRPEVATGAALCDLGWLELMAGQLSEAERRLNEAVQIQQHIGDRWGQCESLGWLGRCYWQGARWTDATAVQRECLDLARSLGNVRQEALAHRHLGLLAWNQGHDDDAILMTSTALELYERMGDRYGEAACLENLAAIYFDQDLFRQASRLLDTSEQICADISSTDFLAYAKLYQAKILIRAGRPERGLESARIAAGLLRRRKYSYFYIGMAVRAQAEALLLLEQRGQSSRLLRQARDRFAGLPSRYQADKCDFWLAQVQHASSRASEAVTLMSRAHDAFAQVGAGRDQQRSKLWLDEWT
jgi:tetratricopeptide (TPR) repeat protein/DNA-binding SARP family transcriptional activator